MRALLTVTLPDLTALLLKIAREGAKPDGVEKEKRDERGK
jgi:hypothetical protein